jgi:hypothetical protein
MDQIKFNVVNEFNVSTSQKEIYIEAILNGQLVGSGSEYPINLWPLMVSTEHPGGYDFWTCSCGIPTCADICVEVLVSFNQNCVRWVLQSLPFIEDVELIFDADSYKKSIYQCKDDFLKAIGKNEEEEVPFTIYPDAQFSMMNQFT